jgi:probable O-glycosylation ligase (exosortase A-associated)
MEEPSSGGGRLKSMIGDVEWTIPFIGLLGYVVATVTFRLPIGQASMIVATLGLLLQGKDLRFPSSFGVFTVFLVWCAVGYFSSPFKVDVWRALQDVWKIWLIALVMVNALRTPGQLRFFLLFFLLCYATHPARGGIFNYLWGEKVFGRTVWVHMYHNPNDLAALTFFPMAVASLFTRDRNPDVRRGALVSVVILPLVILMTQSRGAFFALAAFVMMAWVGQRNRLRALVVMTLLGSISVAVSPAGVWDRMNTLFEEGSDADSSSRQRVLIWEVAQGIIHEHLMTGVGFGAYPSAHNRATLGNPNYELADGYRDTHSTYLNVLAETGIPGLLLFLATVATALFKAEQVRRRLKRERPDVAQQFWYMEVGLIAFMLAAVFGSFVHLAYFYVQIAALVAYTEIYGRASSSSAARARRLRAAGASPALQPPTRPRVLTGRGPQPRLG